MSEWEWEIVEDPGPDPAVEAWLDYISELGKIADTYAFYIGPAVAVQGVLDAIQRYRYTCEQRRSGD